MKYARYLASHSIDEWRRAYIDYRQLKKQIGRAEDELSEIDEGNPPSGGTGLPQRKKSKDHVPKRPLLGREEIEAARDLERGREGDTVADVVDEGAKESEARPRGDAGRPPTLPEQAGSRFSPVSSPLASPGVSHTSDFSREHSDETHHTDTRLVPTRSNASGQSRRPSSRHSSTDLFKAGDRFKPAAQQNLKRWRPGFSPDIDLAEITQRLPHQCRRFFTLLDRELEKVEGFYADREGEMLKRFEELSAQWQELANHKKEYQEFRSRELHAPQVLTSILPRRAPALPGTSLIRRTLASRSPDSALPSGNGHATTDDRRRNGARPSPNGTGEAAGDRGAKLPRTRKAYMHGRPEDYTKARSRLKLATFEYYRSLGMLKSYRVLNRTGFAKALKKYEKATGIPCANQYTKKVDAAHFVSSPKLDELIRQTEDAFATVFEHGDRKRALERLRDFGQKKHHHFAAWRAGMLMGAGLPLMIEGLVKSFQADTRLSIPYWAGLLQLFGACFLPVFFSLAFFLNLAAWSVGRINYVLIFELDVRSKLDYHQFLEIPATLYFILSLFFWAAFNNFWPDHIAPSAYPLAWLVVALVLLLNPFPVFYPSARWWMLRSMCRVVTSGLVDVRFRDFFLGDELNSIYYSVYNLGFLYCVYNKGWPSETESICSTNRTWTTPVLASLPPFFRLGQSLRRYLDSDGLVLHLLNMGKYSASIAYFWFYFNWRIYETTTGVSETWRLALFIVFASINSIYVSTWDILMDWSLGHRNPKHPWLRQELGFFKDRWQIYYVLAVVNVVLRFSWVFYLAPHPSPAVQSYTIALIEAARRIMWNTFRVEAEHIGNRDGFRVTRDVALPYVTASSPEATGHLAEDEDDDDAEAALHRLLPPRQRVFATLHQLHAALVDNFAPIVDLVAARPWFVRRQHETAEGTNEGVTVEDEQRRRGYPLPMTTRRRRDKVKKRRKRARTIEGESSSGTQGSANEDDARRNVADGEDAVEGDVELEEEEDAAAEETEATKVDSSESRPTSTERMAHKASDSDVDEELRRGMAEVEGMTAFAEKAGKA
ncbi:hypothetical protein JCM1841_003062 [Sporobolomyces salmonicolor]